MTEYILILMLSVMIFVAAVRVLRPVFSRFVAAREKALQENLSKGVYRYRIPSR
jgi:hypothetical protein